MAEVIAHNARVASKKTVQVETIQTTKGMGQEESKLHEFIIEQCEKRGWIYLHGAMSKRTHRTLGEFDFCLLANRGRVFFLECKTKDGKLTADQETMKRHGEYLGHKMHVVRSQMQFLEIVDGKENL